eukprot:333232-Pelagomonas_calceolata.AAC.1
MRKGLTVNTSKSEAMHFNSRSCSSLPTFMYETWLFPQKNSLNALGISLVMKNNIPTMLVDKHMNLKVSEKHAVRPYMAA